MTAIQRCILGVLLFAGLAGCTTASRDNPVGHVLVDPSKYETFNFTCQQLSSALNGQKARELELQKLIAKASDSPGGGLVSLIAYRSDYAQARAEQDLIRKVQREKKCTP